MTDSSTPSKHDLDWTSNLIRVLRRATTWKVVAVLLLIYSYVLWEYIDDHGGNFSACICMGDRHMPPSDIPEGIVFLENGAGYDGQFFYFIAQDPLALGDMHKYLDNPHAYRYQRILYPMLTAVLSLGIPALIPTMLVMVNLLAIALGTVFIALMLKERNMSQWYALFYGCLSGLTMGLLRDMSGPLAMGLSVASFYFYGRKRLIIAAVFLSLAILTREVTVALIPVFILDSAVLKKNIKGAAWSAASVLPFVAWEFYVFSALNSAPWKGGQRALGTPLKPMIAHVTEMLNAPPERTPEKIYLFIFLLVVFTSLGFAIREVIQARNEVSLAFLGYSLMPFVMSDNIWLEPWGYGRVLAPGAVMLVLAFVRSESRWYLAPLAMHAALFLVTLDWQRVL